MKKCVNYMIKIRNAPVKHFSEGSIACVETYELRSLYFAKNNNKMVDSLLWAVTVI